MILKVIARYQMKYNKGHTTVFDDDGYFYEEGEEEEDKMLHANGPERSIEEFSTISKEDEIPNFAYSIRMQPITEKTA